MKTSLVAGEMMEDGTCVVIVLAREGAEVHLHAPQTRTEHFWVWVWVNCRSRNTVSLGNNIWTTGHTWLPKMSSHWQ